MNINGSDKQQITHGSANCLRPAYLPRNQVVYTVVTGKGARQTAPIQLTSAPGTSSLKQFCTEGSFSFRLSLRWFPLGKMATLLFSTRCVRTVPDWTCPVGTVGRTMYVPEQGNCLAARCCL